MIRTLTLQQRLGTGHCHCAILMEITRGLSVGGTRVGDTEMFNCSLLCNLQQDNLTITFQGSHHTLMFLFITFPRTLVEAGIRMSQPPASRASGSPGVSNGHHLNLSARTSRTYQFPLRFWEPSRYNIMNDVVLQLYQESGAANKLSAEIS